MSVGSSATMGYLDRPSLRVQASSRKRGGESEVKEDCSGQCLLGTVGLLHSLAVGITCPRPEPDQVSQHSSMVRELEVGLGRCSGWSEVKYDRSTLHACVKAQE